MQAGNLIVIAARPGVGKSSFVTNVARNVAVDAGLPVAMFSLEMSRWEIGMRLLCGEARVPWDSIRNKRVGAEDWSRIAQAADSLHEAPLFIVDSGNVTLVDIRAKARRLSARRQGLGMIIVDYLQLMSHTRRVDNRQQEIAEISRGLKMLAKELEIPVIAVSQLNRDPERRQDKRPQLSDLRESGAIEQDADVVMFIHREDADPAKKGLADLIVAKHRNGPTDTVPLTFLPAPDAVPQPRHRGDVTVDRRRVRALARRLERHFGELAPPRATDPLDELILTVQSQHTSDLNAERAFGLLRARYPTWDDVVRAPTAELAETIRSGGLNNTKAARIQAILREIHRREGRYDLSALASRSDAEIAGVPLVAPRCRAQDGGGRDGLRVRPRDDPGRHARAPGGDATRPGAEDLGRARPAAARGARTRGAQDADARRADQPGSRDLQGGPPPVRGLSAVRAVPDRAGGARRASAELEVRAREVAFVSGESSSRWSGRGESNPRFKLGKLAFYH